MDTNNTAATKTARNTAEAREALKAALVSAAKGRTFARKKGTNKLNGRRTLHTGELAAKIGARCAFVRRWGDKLVSEGILKAAYNANGTVSGYYC